MASFSEQLRRKALLTGTIVTLASTEMVEIYCHAGFDWLFIDLEHSALTFREAQLLLQAADSKVPCLIRIPSNDDTCIKKALDIGAEGIIIPLVQTGDHVRRAVQACKYPPDGTRSVGIARAQGYGAKFQEYVSTANAETAVIIQIEHIAAVTAIEDILAVAGVDGLFIGPYDLAASMGKMGCPDDPEVSAAIKRVSRAARQADMPLGIFGATVPSVESYIKEGYTLVAVGIDTLLMGRTAKDIVSALKTWKFNNRGR